MEPELRKRIAKGLNYTIEDLDIDKDRWEEQLASFNKQNNDLELDSEFHHKRYQDMIRRVANFDIALKHASRHVNVDCLEYPNHRFYDSHKPPNILFIPSNLIMIKLMAIAYIMEQR